MDNDTYGWHVVYQQWIAPVDSLGADAVWPQPLVLPASCSRDTGGYRHAVANHELFSLDTLKLPKALVEAVEHGEVFTRRWVVEAILDLVGYTVDRDLADLRVIEPACGAGAFLGPIVERLTESCRSHGRTLLDAAKAIEAFDLLHKNVQQSRDRIAEQLLCEDWPEGDVGKVVSGWISQVDYLLQKNVERNADFALENPPYIRLRACLSRGFPGRSA